jgi:hypothetical protein
LRFAREHRIKCRTIQMPADVRRRIKEIVVMERIRSPGRTRAVRFLVLLIFEGLPHGQVLENRAGGRVAEFRRHDNRRIAWFQSRLLEREGA